MQAIVLDLFGGLLEENHFISEFMFPGIDKSSQAYKQFKEKYKQVCVGKATEDELRAVAEQFGLNYDVAMNMAVLNIAKLLDPSIHDFKIPVYLFTHFFSRVYEILKVARVDRITKKVFLTSELKLGKIEALPIVVAELKKHHELSQIVIVDDRKEILQAAKKAGFGLTVLRVCETVPAEKLEGIDIIIHELADLINSELR